MNSNHKNEWTEPVRYVGLDVSKARLDYAIEAGKPLAVPNTGAGRAILIGQLQQLPGVRVVCEASGGYEEPLLRALAEAKVSACRVAPGRVRHFARAEGTLAKTDRIDVQLLHRYAQAMHPRETRPLSPECGQLRELLEYRRQLSEQLSVTRQRLELAGPTLRGLLEAQREHLSGQLDQADHGVAAHLKAHPQLQRKAARLQELQGVGPVLAANLLAYLPELGEENDKRLAALVGVAPHPDDSGLSSRPRHTQGGRAELRTVLYMAAVTAAHHNPVLSAFYQRLRAAGKPPKVCLVAVMRKMITVLNRMLHDPNFTLVS